MTTTLERPVRVGPNRYTGLDRSSTADDAAQLGRPATSGPVTRLCLGWTFLWPVPRQDVRSRPRDRRRPTRGSTAGHPPTGFLAGATGPFAGVYHSLAGAGLGRLGLHARPAAASASRCCSASACGSPPSPAPCCWCLMWSGLAPARRTTCSWTTTSSTPSSSSASPSSAPATPSAWAVGGPAPTSFRSTRGSHEHAVRHSTSAVPTHVRGGNHDITRLVYHGPGSSAWEQVPTPELVDDTDAIVRVDCHDHLRHGPPHPQG